MSDWSMLGRYRSGGGLARFSLATVCAMVLGCGRSAPPTPEQKPPEVALPPAEPAVPYSFKDFQLGMTLKEFMAKKPSITFRGKEDDGSGQYFFINTTIAEVKTSGLFNFIETTDGLKLKSINFNPKKYNYYQIKEALEAKYGPALQTSNSEKRNAMGATFSGEVLEWSNGVSSIRLEEVGSKIDEMSLRYRHDKLREDISKRRAVQKARAKDL